MILHSIIDQFQKGFVNRETDRITKIAWRIRAQTSNCLGVDDTKQYLLEILQY